MILLLVLACQKPALTPQDVELSGRISVNWDDSLQRGRIAVLRYVPSVVPLPAERQGIAMESCATVVPRQALDGVLRETEVSVTCDGEPMALRANATGFWVHHFTDPQIAGLSCEVTLDGERIPLPTLPEVPDLTVRGRRMQWTAGESDEIRVVYPRSQGESTICRFEDDGEAIGPRPGRLAFVTRHNYALPKVDDGRVAVTVTAGGWWEREAEETAPSESAR